MENLTHSLSKKSYGGNGFGMSSHKSVYDDVFGGPPKFGVPTLAPRFEDYSEIFGGFHSSRGSSIPILDLPVVEEVELAFDVRSSRLDYSEVFGDFDGFDFAVSFEDLVRKSNGGDDPCDDAWSPAQSESLSDESDPASSERSQSLLNADAHHRFGDARQFNVSYHKVNEKTSQKISDRAAHIAQVHTIPGPTYVINETHASPIIEDEGPELQASGDLKSNTEFVGRTVDKRCFKKSISLPTNSGFRAPGSDPQHVESSGSAFTQKKPFVTVNDISLRTRPSRLPPPSRPPPVFAVKKGEPEKPNSKLRHSNSYAFERIGDESSPPFYDVEMDSSSSKAASVAMKVVMEKAQAKIRSAKESLEKKEVLQSHLKLPAQDSMKIVEEEMNKTSSGGNSRKDEMVQEMFARGCGGMQHVAQERPTVIKMTLEASDLIDGENYIDLVEEPIRRMNTKESSSQVSHKPEGACAWRQETEYFEVVETDISLKAVEEEKDAESNVLQNIGSEDDRHGIEAATGTSQPQEVIKEVKASKEAPKFEETRNQLEIRKDTCEWVDNGERSNKTMESSCQKENPKNVKVDFDSRDSEMGKKRAKKAKQHGDKQIEKDADKSVTNLAKAERDVIEVEVKDKPNGMSERTDSYEVIVDVHAKKADESRRIECIVSEECDKKLEEAVERVEDVKWEILQEDRKKQEDYSEIEESKKKQKEVYQGKENESKLKEAIKQEDHVNRLNVATEHEERENNLRTCEQEDKERHQKPDCEMVDKKGRVLETHNLVEDEKQCEVACETGELDARLTDFWEQDLGKSGSTVALEEEVTEENSRLTSALEGRKDMSQTAFKHEELSEQTEDANLIKWGGIDRVVNLDQGHDPSEGLNINSLAGQCKLNHNTHETFEAAQAALSCGKDKKSKTNFKNGEQGLDIRTSEFLVEEISLSFGKNQHDLQQEEHKIQIEDDMELPCLHDHVIDSNGAGHKQEKKVPQVACDPEKMRVNTHDKGQRGKVINGVQVSFSEEIAKEKSTIPKVFTEWTEKKIGAALPSVLTDRKNTLNTQQRGTSQNAETKERHVNVTLSPEERKIEERLHQDRELEKEHLRRIEEEREREREREKDRMAVDRAALEARERSHTEARDRAERAAMGRATAEVRQRVVVEARGRLDKESVEARLRAERAAVERATAEARQRAFEKAMAEKASFEARERVERSVSDKFYGSSRNAEMRQSSSSSVLPDLQNQNAGTSNMLRYSYSSANAGVEGESPQRCKARLERYRRTAERAAKALAEKNMRDLLAQREQAERSRLAEMLDAEVRRWSSGKEGNLRALLSTLQYILGPDSGWQPVPLTEVITSAAVKKAYRKATLCVHPDKLQQRGASIQQKYICEKVFDLLKEAWNTFNSEEW